MYEFLYGIWFILPAYAASGFAVLSGGKIVIDFNKKFLGKRIFGDGKTVSGFVGGVLVGAFIGLIINMGAYIGFIIAFGAMLGDLVGSFIKRRFGIERGESVILLDQLDFVAGALIFGYFIDILPSTGGIFFILILGFKVMAVKRFIRFGYSSLMISSLSRVNITYLFPIFAINLAEAFSLPLTRLV